MSDARAARGSQTEAMTEPGEWAERMERDPLLPAGDGERFAGYGVISLPFASGDVLALRRFPACSLGPAMTSVWHRSPDGEWEFFSDVSPLQCCPRYFGGSGTRATATPIHLTWPSDRELHVSDGEGGTLEWTIRLAPTPATRLLNAAAGRLPEPLWRQPWLLAIMGRLAGPLLGTGRLRLQGRAPSRQWFVINPRLVWAVTHSQARLADRDLGAPSPLSHQARLGDFWIPQRGLFAVGQAFFEPFDPIRHASPALACEPPAPAVAAVS